MAPDSVPNYSDWAALREAQSKTLAVPSTGQAVIIDIGEANDIHPRNKQDVGLRLALSALHVAYNQNVVYSGPVYKSMQKVDNKLILTFDNTGSGLEVKDKYGYAKAFAVAGEDQKFVWAKAYIENGKVIVYHPDIKNPVAVRYAWGNNPDDANLYNKEGLPASPFRTDNWK
jgi:sialate O-acetylesterase